MAPIMLATDGCSRRTRSVYPLRTQIVKRLNPEEQIRSRLRELTEKTRLVREELQEMIRKNARGHEHIEDGFDKLKRRKPEP